MAIAYYAFTHVTFFHSGTYYALYLYLLVRTISRYLQLFSITFETRLYPTREYLSHSNFLQIKFPFECQTHSKVR